MFRVGVCFYDHEQENYRFFTWGETNTENIISLISEKIKEYEVEKVIFAQPRSSTKIVKKSFASLALTTDFQVVSKEIVQEINSLLNKGIYSITNLERKSGFWHVKEQRILTSPQLIAYLALVHYLEKESGQKLVQENETPQPFEKEKNYDKQPPIIFAGKIVKCEEHIVKKGANKGSPFYSLLIEHNNSEIPCPASIVVFHGLLRDKTVWPQLTSKECLNRVYTFHCWGDGKGFSLSFWEK
ncbi:hypothetical protein [endosymbiont GvMRE of Glomus versiforme]|uniref:hypothetical protein n=1 Tax=endosymbiont GvMRE of Glomus versiforme TaxID=2039283 RepID=UPI000EC325B7|nr:hypothetical protein [endosymbiont GvMRE of Glomus versiforme]RHZ37674.1 hypothetical protein GvMRE_I1g191 [endosymbiont GvMRE of Glomus versiforme]